MAKFCTKCGKPLKEGEVCDCQKTTTKEEECSSSIVENIKDILKNIIKKPATTIEKYSKQKNLKFAFLLIVINAVIFGLFTYCFSNNVIKSITKDVNSTINTMNTIGSAFSQSSSIDSIGTVNNFELPFGNLFISGTIGMILAFIILALILKLIVGVIFKNKKQVSEYLTLVGVSSVISSITTLAALLLSFLSYKLAYIVLLFGTVFYFVNVTQNLLKAKKANEERLSYMISTTLIITYAVAIFVYLLVVSIFIASSMRGMYY